MSIDAMKQALEALENWMKPCPVSFTEMDNAITALRAAIEQAEKQEPVAWMIEFNGGPTGNLFRDQGHATREMQRLNMLYPKDCRRLVPLYTVPPQRQPLTEEEIQKLWEQAGGWYEMVRAIEKHHGIGGAA